MVAAKVKMNANGAHTFLEVGQMISFLYLADIARQDRQGPLWHVRSFVVHILWRAL